MITHNNDSTSLLSACFTVTFKHAHFLEVNLSLILSSLFCRRRSAWQHVYVDTGNSGDSGRNVMRGTVTGHFGPKTLWT